MTKTKCCMIGVLVDKEVRVKLFGSLYKSADAVWRGDLDDNRSAIKEARGLRRWKRNVAWISLEKGIKLEINE